MNDNGVAAGFYVDAGGNSHGYVYNISTPGFTEISLPGADGATSFAATGINNAGEVIGFFLNGTVTEGFQDNGGTFKNFEATGSTNTIFLGINNNGQVVGVYQDGGGHIDPGPAEESAAFVRLIYEQRRTDVSAERNGKIAR